MLAIIKAQARSFSVDKLQDMSACKIKERFIKEPVAKKMFKIHKICAKIDGGNIKFGQNLLWVRENSSITVVN